MLKFLEKHEKALLVGLFIIFCAVTIPGIAWGVPSLWHPDEVVRESIAALAGELRFDEVYFDHPSLPKYVMYGLGWVIYKMGYAEANFIVAARLLSVLLGAFVMVIAYRLTRLLGGKVSTSLIAALIIITTPDFSAHSRWAHNDLYVTFFASLSVYALVKFSRAENKLWLYLSFLAVGWAASSKYIGGILLLAPLSIYLFARLDHNKKELLPVFETLFIGVALCGIGFAMGTPKSALWFAYYVKRLIPALQHLSTFSKTPGSVIGLFGQWMHLLAFIGIPLFILSLLAFGSVVFALLKTRIQRQPWSSQQRGLTVLVLAILALDLPILASYNLQERFFLPFFPFLAVLLALWLETLLDQLASKDYQIAKMAVTVALILILAFNVLQIVSVNLLFQNDARIAASEYLKTFSPGRRIEYTFYPPTIPRENFSSAHNYPLAFIQYPDQEIPTSPVYAYNVGEAGVAERRPDYLVIDSFTYDRFADENTCKLLPADCDFFARLRAGETNYVLIKEFRYKLPGFLPDPKVIFLNPDLEVYQREE
jgi:hypothetical protein